MSNRAAVRIALPALPCAPAIRARQATAEHGFDTSKRLVGTWREAGRPDSPLRVRFSLTAGGSVLTESWGRGDRARSLTAYHRDASAIVAAHYCPQGNQPRPASRPRSRGGIIRFAFRDATDLDVAREAYPTAPTLDLSSGPVLVRRGTYRQGGSDETSELRPVRDG